MGETQAKLFELWMELWKLLSHPGTPWVISFFLFALWRNSVSEVRKLTVDLDKKNRKIAALESTIERLQ